MAGEYKVIPGAGVPAFYYNLSDSQWKNSTGALLEARTRGDEAYAEIRVGGIQVDGLMNHSSAGLAQLAADVTALALPAGAAGQFILLQSADALGPWTIRGIVNVRPGDCLYIVNNGVNSFLLGHQDAGAAAADRIISPTGADLTLAQDQTAKLWYDSVSTRWRVLETTGS